MEIIVKRDILDEFQARGLCPNAQIAESFFQMMLEELITGIGKYKKVIVEGLGSFTGAGKKDVRELPSDEFVGKLISSLKTDKAKAKKMVATWGHFIKEMVIKGHEVQLLDFAHFRLEEKKSHILKSPPKGQSAVIPPRKIIVFDPQKKLFEKTGLQEIQFSPSETFQKHIARLKSSSILLLVPARDFFIEAFEYHFKKAGWKINTALNVEEAKQQLAGGKNYLVILDSQVPNYQNISEMVKFSRDTSLIPVVIMYPKGTDLKKPQGFRICGDEQLLQPFEIKQLIQIAEVVLKKSMEEKAIFKQELMFQFLTTDQHIDKANELCGKLFGMSGLEEEEQISMGAAFREAVANAAQHGNKHRRDKMLEVLYLLDKEKIIISVKDSGFGFDWRKYLSVGEKGDAVGRARQSHREGRLGGLGIMLMLRCVDKLEYNDTGNEITIAKYIKKKS